MTKPRLVPEAPGYNAFHLGLETYRYEHELHFPWDSSVEGSHRVWLLHLGLWVLIWESK